MGDRLILNADTIAMILPVTEKTATTQKWTKGSCIQGMGTHWAYDVSTAPKMSWQDSNLLPVGMHLLGVFYPQFFSTKKVEVVVNNSNTFSSDHVLPRSH